MYVPLIVVVGFDAIVGVGVAAGVYVLDSTPIATASQQVMVPDADDAETPSSESSSRTFGAAPSGDTRSSSRMVFNSMHTVLPRESQMQWWEAVHAVQRSGQGLRVHRTRCKDR